MFCAMARPGVLFVSRYDVRYQRHRRRYGGEVVRTASGRTEWDYMKRLAEIAFRNHD
jgi:predicted alpha/beta-hydrolase family hydrolase